MSCRFEKRLLEESKRVTLEEALLLFRRLGIDPGSISDKEFSAAYYRLAKRYHPDLNPGTSELMAHINAARSAILKSSGQVRTGVRQTSPQHRERTSPAPA